MLQKVTAMEKKSCPAHSTLWRQTKFFDKLDCNLALLPPYLGNVFPLEPLRLHCHLDLAGSPLLPLMLASNI